MGRVYLARQHVPERLVAVKVLRDGLASGGVLKRFEQEAQLLAMLRHPRIAQVHTAGTWNDGIGPVPFFVMELVEQALPIDRFVRDRGLSVRQRLELFHGVAGAVAHGHRQGIVHRDLKPGNVLVGADGEPKVIDFGVARSTDADLHLTTLHTAAGQLVGTLRYMSPEQFDADVARIDQRTDVYSLGLVLHELLVGALPYDLRGASLVAAAHIIREQPSRASATLPRALASEPGLTVVEARQLGAIVEKCLEKRPADRYASADDLHGDVGRWLEGLPVLARPATLRERSLRLVRRHRLAAALTMVAIGVGVAAIAFSIQARGQARIAARFEAAEREESYYATVHRAAAAADRGNVPLAGELLDRARATANAVAGLPIELECLAARLDDSVSTLRGGGAVMRAVAASPAGDWIAAGDDAGVIRLWTITADGGVGIERRWQGHAAAVWSAVGAADGRHLLTTAGDGTAVVWDAAAGTVVRSLERHPAAVYGGAISVDGASVATAGGDGRVRLWRVADGVLVRELVPAWDEAARDRNVYAVSFLATGERLAAACGDGVVRQWEVATGEPLAELRGHGRRVLAVRCAADGRRIAAAAEDGTARLWDAATGVCTAVLRHPLRVNAVAWDADGSRLVTVTADAVVRCWDAASGLLERRLHGHRAAVWSVAGLGDGRFVTAGADVTTRLWDVSGRADAVLRTGGAGGSGVRGVACSPDGRLVATATASGRLLLWDAATCRVSAEVPAGRSRVNAVEFSPGGDFVATACGDGSVGIAAVTGSGEGRQVRPHAGAAFAVRFSADGRRIASAGADRQASGPERGTVCVHEVCVGKAGVAGPPSLTLPHPARAYGVAWSADGRRLVSGCADGVLREWDATDGRLIGSHAGHTADVNWVTFSGDGRRLATCSSDGTVRLWSPAEGWRSLPLSGPVGQVWEVAFTPDGSRVAGAGADGSLHLWHTASGRHLLALAGHEGPIWGVAVTADGRSIVTGSDDGTARFWGVTPAEVSRRRRSAGDRD